MAGAAGRWPDAVGDGLVAQPGALVEAPVRPDMEKARHRASHRRHGGENGRHRHAARHGLAPQFDGRLYAAGLEHIGAHLVAGAEYAWPQRWDEIERDISIHRHGGDVFADAEWICRLERGR